VVALHARLDVVVAVKQPLPLALAEQPPELGADPGVPVDERPVAVEGGPAVDGSSSADVES
jgi:hypothetical protein